MSGKTSALFRSVWKGSDGLASSRGRLRLDEFTRALHALGWRDLGLLLVQLVRPLDDSVPDPGDEQQGAKHWVPWIRCLLALAGSITHMQSVAATSSGLVNQAFVTKIFAAIARSAALVSRYAPDEYPTVAPIVFRCVSCVLVSPDNSDSNQASPRFAPDAVLDGLTAPYARSPDEQQHLTKRRRIVNEQVSPFLELLADALQTDSAAHAHRYVVRILRARNNAVVSRNTDSAVAAQLIRALAGMGCELCDPEKTAAVDEAYVGNVFACIRDTMDHIEPPPYDSSDMPLHIEATARLSLALSTLFRPYVTMKDHSTSLYAFCAEKRHRCYQWAALCHASTWISGWQSAPKVAESLAECSRLCWLQITDTAPADPRIWCLLLSESLGHIGFDSTRKSPVQTPPLFMASDDAQTQVFTALAPLLTRISGLLPILATNRVPRPLVLTSLRTCGRLLRHVRPQAASMGLFRPASQCADIVREEGVFHQVGCSLDAYVFRPTLLPSDEPTQSPKDGDDKEEHGIQPDSSVEQVREDSEEAYRESVLATVFDSLVVLASTATATRLDNNAGDSAALANTTTAAKLDNNADDLVALAFRVLLRWIGAFATSARDNAGTQARILESQKRINIGVFGDKTRLSSSATDWSRLQKVPIVRLPQGDSDETGRRTCKPVAAQAIRLFAALSVWPVLSDTTCSVLERCLVWSDADDGPVFSAEQACRFCVFLNSTLPTNALDTLAFSSLQILASILGVRSHLAARELKKLRLPHLQVRSHSPQSSEALMQLAMKTGLCRLLLEPGFLVRCVDSVCSGRVMTNPLALRSGQMWLDMIGNVARHSLFRTYVGLAHTAKQNHSSDVTSLMPTLPFTTWWSLALASSTRCLLAVVKASDVSADHVRLACILPSHLLSWHLFVPISESSIRSFVNSPTSTVDLDQVLGGPHGRFKSIISVVCFLACGAWREFAILDQELSDIDEPAMLVCRDVWGIASDSLHLLQRMLQYDFARRVFVDLGLVGELASVVCDLVARQALPRLVTCILDVPETSSTPPPPPAPADVDPLASDIIELGKLLEFISESDEDTEPKDDVVAKLLYDSAQHHKPAIKQRALSEYHSSEILARLWSAFVNELLELPVHIMFVEPRSKHINAGVPTTDPLVNNRWVDVVEWLSDKNNVLFQMLTSLLAVKEHLSRPNTLWQAISTTAPIEALAAAVTSPFANSSVPRVCVSAALVLPELETTHPLDAVQRVVPIVVRCLVHRLKDDYDTSAVALMFMAWRQRTLISHHIRDCAARLQRAANEMLAEMAASHSLVARLEDPDLVLLSGTGMCEDDLPIRTSLTLLTRHSTVFDAMFAGSFSEANAIQSGVRQFRLQDNHAALSGLITILHECTSSGLPDNCRFDLTSIVRILALAIFYDARPAVVFLVWRLCEMAGDISALPDDSLDTLAMMFGENWNLYLSSTSNARDVCCLLSSVLLLHLDRVDILSAIETSTTLFTESVTGLFSK